MELKEQLFLTDFADPISFYTKDLLTCDWEKTNKSIKRYGGKPTDEPYGDYTVRLVSTSKSGGRTVGREILIYNTFSVDYIKDCISLKKILLLEDYWIHNVAFNEEVYHPTCVMLGWQTWDNWMQWPMKPSSTDFFSPRAQTLLNHNNNAAADATVAATPSPLAIQSPEKGMDCDDDGDVDDVLHSRSPSSSKSPSRLRKPSSTDILSTLPQTPLNHNNNAAVTATATPSLLAIQSPEKDMDCDDGSDGGDVDDGLHSRSSSSSKSPSRLRKPSSTDILSILPRTPLNHNNNAAATATGTPSLLAKQSPGKGMDCNGRDVDDVSPSSSKSPSRLRCN